MSTKTTVIYGQQKIIDSYIEETSSTSIYYQGNLIANILPGETKTLNTAQNYCSADITIGGKVLGTSNSFLTENLCCEVIGIAGNKPTALTPSTTYTGSLQYNGYTTPENVTLTGNNCGINAGTYTANYQPNTGYTWSDGTRDIVTITLTINKAQGSISLSSSSITVYSTSTVTATFIGDGTKSVSSSSTGIATVSLSGNTISISRVAKGSAKVTVSISEGANYTAASTTIAVTTVLVPTGYQQVQYLQGDGYNTYINSGVYSSTSLQFEVQCLFTRNCLGAWVSEMVIAASDSSTTWPSNSCAVFKYLDDSGNTAGCIQGSSSAVTGLSANLNTVYTFTRSGVTLANGSRPIALFAHNAGGTIREYGAVRIYYCKFYSGSTLIRNFLPCYRKSDGVRGMYDNVNNAFYTNAGSGTFGIGGAV